MTTLITILLFLLANSTCLTGTMSQYAESPTNEVIRNRLIPGRTAYTLPDNWEEYDGYIAVKDCGDLGNVYRIYWQGNTARVLAYDCSGHASTTSWMTRNNILGEVSYGIARDWGVIGRGMRGAVMCQIK